MKDKSFELFIPPSAFIITFMVRSGIVDSVWRAPAWMKGRGFDLSRLAL
jgi:hypothetical protein